jgi:nitrate reductase gamma subunit
MNIGAGIFLVVVGAILRFALNVQLSWIDLQLVGSLLMGAGVVVIVIGIVLLVRKRSTVTTVRTAVDPQSGENIAQRETKVDPLP